MKKSISTLIREGRARKNINQRDLAKIIGCSPAAVSQWEQGDKIPYGDTMIEVIKALNLVEEVFPEAFEEIKKEHEKKQKEIKTKMEDIYSKMDQLNSKIDTRIEEVKKEIDEKLQAPG